MKVSLRKIDKESNGIISALSRYATRERVPIYIVGGIVRDLLLKRPCHDLDIVVDTDAIAFARKIKKKIKGTLKEHKSFGTAAMHLSSGRMIDFATARKERYKKAGALPTVSQGALQDDLFRRDFTINAMAININEDDFGVLIDLYGGLEDVKNRKIRILHVDSFKDDPTRILRAIKYEGRLGFSLERKTLKRLQESVCTDGFKSISEDRYFNELKKIFAEKEVKKIVRRLDQLNVLSHLDKDLDINYHRLCMFEKNLRKSQKNVSVKPVKRWFLVLLCLLEGNKMEVVDRAIQRFSFTKDQKECLRYLKRVPEFLSQIVSAYKKPSELYQLLNGCPDEMVSYLWFRSANQKLRVNISRYLKVKGVQLLINGKDIQKVCSLSGQKIGLLMKEIYYQKLDSKIRTKKEEIRAAKTLALNY